MRSYVECPECCYSVSGDAVRALTKVEQHMDEKHPDSHKQVIETELDED